MKYVLLLILLLPVLAQAQTPSDTCADGDQLVLNTSLKKYQCVTPGTQPLPIGSGTNMMVANASSTGTTVNRFAKLTGAPSTAVITSTSDTENAIGVVVSGAGTTGSAIITIVGQVSCEFDGATTAGNYVTISSTTAGKCHDAGSSYPTSGATYGRVLSTNGGAGTYVMELMTPDVAFQNAGNGKSKPGTPANSYQYNSSNTFSGGNLFRVDANTNQQSNTTSAQTFNLYKTTDSDASPTNYERLQLSSITGSNPFTITSQAGGTGTVRDLTISSGTANTTLSTGSTLTIGGSTTQLIPSATNTITLGSATRAWSNVLAVNLFATSAGSIGFNGGSGPTFTSNSSGTAALTFIYNATWAGAIRDFTAASGSTNNPDFGTSSYFYRIAPNAAGSTLTGARDMAQTGEVHLISNTGSALLTLANNNSGSNSGRRWLSANNLDLNLPPNQMAPYWNDGSTGNIRVGKFESSETVRVGTQFDKTSSTALADVTDLTIGVQASRIYDFEAVLYTTSNVAGGVQFAIAGTATATAIIYEAVVVNGAALGAQTRATALGTTVGGVTTVTAAYARITGTITVNAAGTLTVQFAQNSSSGSASSVLVGSTFCVNNIR